MLFLPTLRGITNTLARTSRYDPPLAQVFSLRRSLTVVVMPPKKAPLGDCTLHRCCDALVVDAGFVTAVRAHMRAVCMDHPDPGHIICINAHMNGPDGA